MLGETEWPSLTKVYAVIGIIHRKIKVVYGSNVASPCTSGINLPRAAAQAIPRSSFPIYILRNLLCIFGGKQCVSRNYIDKIVLQVHPSFNIERRTGH
jgi:hypothetical protein